MSLGVTHAKVTAIPDAGDASLVEPSDWNAGHVISMATGKLLGRSTAGTGTVEEITVGSGLLLSGGTLSSTDVGGTVTSVSVSLATTGTDLSFSVSNPTTTPAIALSVPTASAANRGALSSTDWSTFNGKQAAITFGTGTLTALGVNVGSAGAIVVNGGALGTPSSGTLTNCTGLPIAGGGTGQTTANAALNALLPAQAGNNGKFLSTNGTDTSWATVSGAGTVTSVAQTFTGGLISVAGSPITTNGTLALTVAGTSGGIPYFSSSSGWASSAALSANAIVIGGGAGAAPATTTTGTGVLTALGINVGSAGALVTNGGALGTPSSGTVTNLTGTASININGTVGATTPATGAFTTLSASSLVDISGASAGQIKFPATQNASANANTLDDYEEGTCTIVFALGGSSTGVAYGARPVNYTKIGNQVTIFGYMALSNKGSGTGNATLSGFPFNFKEYAGTAGFGILHSMTELYFSFTSGSDSLYIYRNATGNIADESTIASNDSFYFAFSYLAA